MKTDYIYDETSRRWLTASEYRTRNRLWQEQDNRMRGHVERRLFELDAKPPQELERVEFAL